MARIILALCLLISSVVSAQPGYTNINSRYKWIAGGFDSSLILPRYNGVPSGLRSAWNTDGQLAVDTANNRLYVYSGGAWVRVANYSDVGSTYTFPYSVVAPGNAIQLENDTTANPANYFYGRNSAGRRGWYPQSGITGVNIYNSDGTLTGYRTVNGNYNGFEMVNISSLSINIDGNEGMTGGIDISGDNADNNYHIRTIGSVGESGIYGYRSENKLYSVTTAGSDSSFVQTDGENGISIKAFDGSLKIPLLNYTLSTTGKKIMIRDTATGDVWNIDPALIGGGSTPISSLTAATGSNSIDNEDNFQSWDFTNFSTIGLGLFGETTQATGNGTRLFVASTYGANANSSQTTFAADFINSHTGTSSTNVGARFMATSGTNNYAAQFSRGRVSFGTVAQESGYLELNGSSTGTIGITTAAAAGTYTLTLPTTDGSSGEFLQTDGSGVLSWAAGGGTGGITVGTTTITSGTSGRIAYNNAGIYGEKAVTGTGDVVLATSPTLVTPNIGVASGTSLTLSGLTTRRVLYNNDGLIKDTSAFTYSSSGELLVNTTTDLGNYNLQVGGQMASQRYDLYASGGGLLGGLINNSGYMALNSSSLMALLGSSDIWINAGVDIAMSPRVAIGSSLGAFTATARLHIVGGTATANTAPLKFTSGTNLTTAEAGAMEYDGTNLFFTPSSAARNSILMTASVNSVSPTSPNRTITVVIDGTTYYISAKTTND